LLNICSLGSPQNEKFSGYFIYDGLATNEEQGRLHELQILQEHGYLNLIVFANLVFGNPVLDSTDIREIITDPERFARITVPENDFVKQGDGYNCGIIAWMCMHEMSLCHCFKYQTMSDFVRQEMERHPVFELQAGDWFKLYRGDTPGKKKRSTLPNNVYNTIRVQGLNLYNRIISMKSGRIVHPLHPDKTFAGWCRNKFRTHVWDVEDKTRRRSMIGINTLRGTGMT